MFSIVTSCNYLHKMQMLTSICGAENFSIVCRSDTASLDCCDTFTTRLCT